MEFENIIEDIGNDFFFVSFCIFCYANCSNSFLTSVVYLVYLDQVLAKVPLISHQF